jgi:HlyD family secretion protein
MNKILIGIALAALASGCANTPMPTPTPAAQEATTLPAAGGFVRAEARVVPAHHASLSLPVGGVVAELLVVEGDSVAAAQPLLRVSRARAEAAVAQAEADLAVARATYERLREGATLEEVAAAEAAVAQARAQLRQTAGGVTQSDVAAAQAQLAQAQAAQAQLQQGPAEADLEQAEAQLTQAQAAARAQRDGLSAAKVRAQSQLEQAANALRDAQDTYSRIYWENREAERLPGDLPQARQDEEAAALRAVQNAEEAMNQARLALTVAQEAEVSGVAAAEAQVRDAQARLDGLRAPATPDQVLAARAQVAASRADLERLRGDERAGALDMAQAAVAQAEANLARLKAGATEGDLVVAAAQVQRAEAALDLARVALDETELRAPFAGTVAAIPLRPGEYVAVGTPAIEIADLSEWQIETTDLTEQNVAHIREGDRASISLDAIPDLDLAGTVSHIQTLGENQQGDITYAVTITLDEQDPRLRWNMTASVRFEER